MRLEVLDTQLCVGCQSCMFACSRRAGVAGLTESRIGVRSAGGMENGFVVVVCRACEDPPCARVCPTEALTLRQGGGVRLAEEKCIGCGNCVKACVLGAVFWNHETAKPMICIHCGYCARYCPHGVLGLSNGSRGARTKGPEAPSAKEAAQ
jgi:carbon-monoxide dehydrogenase iron sulfur subunit